MEWPEISVRNSCIYPSSYLCANLVPMQSLFHALTDATERVRTQYPELTDEDVRNAYTTYREHFAAHEADPPVADQKAVDELLYALWDIIVERETEGVDQVEDLEAFYVTTFQQLLAPPTPAEEQVLIAQAKPVDTSPVGPPPVEQHEVLTAEDLVEDVPQKRIYTVRISLDGSQPEIWRRVLIPADVPQTELHYILQAAMGWRGSEQFQFLPPQDRELPSSGEPTLADLLPKEGDDCGYEFDRGTTWYHHLELESIGTPEGRRRYPVCTAGQRACPPEDIGGLKAYEEMLERMKDPTQSEYREMNGWLTQDFNPASFNIEQANLRLSRHGQVSFQAVV